MDQWAFLLGIPQEFWPRPDPPVEESWEILEEVLATDLSGSSAQLDESQRFLEDFFNSQLEKPTTTEASTQTDAVLSTIILIQNQPQQVDKPIRRSRAKSTKSRVSGGVPKTSSRLGRTRSTDSTVCFNCKWTKAECISGHRPLMYSDRDGEFRCKACHTHHKNNILKPGGGERTSRKPWEPRKRKRRIANDPGDHDRSNAKSL